MNSTEKLIFTCQNSACGRIYKMKRPQRDGIYKVKCPYCGDTRELELSAIREALIIPVERPAPAPAPAATPKTPPHTPSHNPAQPPIPKKVQTKEPVPPAAPAPRPQPKPQQPAQPKQPQTQPKQQPQAQPKQQPKTGETPDFSIRQPIEMSEQLIVNRQYSIDCPHCHKKGISYTPSKTGKHIVACPACKGKLTYLIIKPTWHLDTKGAPVTTPVFSRAKLTLLRKNGNNQSFQLHEGAQTVGRADVNVRSDININDQYMSRRSIEIVMKLTNEGYRFSIEVLKCTNPVLINGKVIEPGMREFLNFNDEITVGHTLFRLEKA